MSALAVAGVFGLVGAALYYGGRRALKTAILDGYPRSDISYRSLSDSEMYKTLDGKQAWIIGGTKGIGAVLAVELARRGANVTITGRSDVDHVLEKIQAAGPSGKHSFLPADISKMSNCRDLVKRFREVHKSIDYLFLTAGFLASPKKEVTSDGVELDFAISYLARYVILKELKPWLRELSATQTVKVFVWGGPGKPSPRMQVAFDWPATVDDAKYDFFKSHWNGHVANEALVHANKSEPFAIFGMHPGLVPADIYRDPNGMTGLKALAVRAMANWVGTPPQQYIQNVLKIVTSPDIDNKVSGAIFNNNGDPILPNEDAIDNTSRIMELSEALSEAK